MVKKIFIISLLCAVGIVFLYLDNFANTKSVGDRLVKNISVDKIVNVEDPKKTPPVIQEMEPVDISKAKIVDGKNIRHQDKSAEYDDLFFSQFKYLTKNSFSSSDDITSAYLYEDGTVSKAALEDTFSVGDFNEFIERIRMIDKSESASLRESMLADKLNNLKNIKIYSENYSCAGKICTISFDFEGLDEGVDELSQFTKNYVFNSIVVDEYGNKKLRAIYIETDDPSSLTLNFQ